MDNILEYVLIGIGLSMDAFAVAITSGASMKFCYRYAFRIAFFFGFFQAIMPLIGWLAGIGFTTFISGIDHWIAFGLLSFIGGKMIYGSLKTNKKEKEDKEKDCVKFTNLLLLSIATSIDALAVGVTFSMLQVSIIIPILIIGVITFILSFLGVLIGNKSPKHWFEDKIEIIGGIILIGIGIKILVQHLFFS